MKAPSRSRSRSVRALVALAAVIVIMLISVLGNESLSPGKWHQQFKVGLGIDLSGGTEVVLKAETRDGNPPASGVMQQANSVLQSRVNGTGNSGAQVQQQGSDMINVTVPGKPSDDVVNLVTHASQMSVRPVYLEAPYVPPSETKANSVAYGDSSLVNAVTLKLFDKEVCQPGRNDTTVNPSWQNTVGYSLQGDQWAALKGQIVSCDSSGTKYVLGQAAYVGSDITSVTAGLQPNSAQWVVDLSLNAGAAAQFATLTTSQYNSYSAGSRSGNQDDQALDSTAVVLDGNVTSAEVTAEPITAGNVQITGGGSSGFTQAQATSLADALKYGSLPLDFQLLNREHRLRPARPQLAGGRPDRGDHRTLPGDDLPVCVLPGPRRGGGLQPAARRAPRLPGSGTAQQVPELHDVTAGYRRPRRGDRNHGGLVHRVLRTAPRRGPRRQDAAPGRGKRLEARPAHHPDVRHGVVPRCGRAVPLHGWRRAGICLHPRPDHPDRRPGGVPVHQAHGDPARWDKVLQWRAPLVRPRPRPARRQDALALLNPVGRRRLTSGGPAALASRLVTRPATPSAPISCVGICRHGGPVFERAVG